MTRNSRNESEQRRDQGERGARREMNQNQGASGRERSDRGDWGSSDADGQYDRERSRVGSSGEERYGRYQSGRQVGGGDYRDEQMGSSFGNGGRSDRNRGAEGDDRGFDYQPRGNRSWNDAQGDRGIGEMQTSSQRTSGSRDRGEHFGKGPKGYSRTDARIKEDVSDALMRHGELDASNIEVSVNNGDVTLSGTVTDRRMKRAAEDCAEECLGVDQVQNNIRVVSASNTGEKKDAKRRSGNASDTKSDAAHRL
jgi:osmotically-inducible protein OsmY